MSIAPRRMVRIWKWRIPAMGLFYLFLVALIGLSLVLPWTHITAVFNPTHPTGSCEGYIIYDAYIWGSERLSVNLYGVDAEGRPSLDSNLVLSSMTLGELIYFVGCVAVLLLYLAAFLTEMNIIRLERKYEMIFEAIATSLMLIILISFGLGSETLLVGLPSQINIGPYTLTASTIGGLRSAIYGLSKAIMGDYPRTDVNFSLYWGPGYFIFFIAFIIAFLSLVDRKIVKEKLDLSWYWRLRLHLAILALLAMFFPVAEHVEYRAGAASGAFFKWLLLGAIKYTDSGITIISRYATEASVINYPSLESLIFAVSLILTLVIIFLTVAILPSKHLTKETPFITLTLPEDEIIRRHKMLPKITMWLKLMDWLVMIISIVAIYFGFRFYVWQLGLISIYLAKGGIGFLWTTAISYIVVTAIVIQFLITLVPVKRG